MPLVKLKPLCELCEGREPDRQSRRCATCRRLMSQAANTGATKGRTSIYANEAKDAIRTAVQLGRLIYPNEPITYACFYSQIPLNTNVVCSAQGDYASFDHAVPNDPSKAYLCSRTVNDFKGLMTAEEFRKFICEVMDIAAPRRLHGLNRAETREYLCALRAVMLVTENSIGQSRSKLKELSAAIRFESSPLQTPGETVAIADPK
jgi:hypothetical protein